MLLSMLNIDTTTSYQLHHSTKIKILAQEDTLNFTKVYRFRMQIVEQYFVQGGPTKFYLNC